MVPESESDEEMTEQMWLFGSTVDPPPHFLFNGFDDDFHFPFLGEIYSVSQDKHILVLFQFTDIEIVYDVQGFFDDETILEPFVGQCDGISLSSRACHRDHRAEHKAVLSDISRMGFR